MKFTGQLANQAETQPMFATWLLQPKILSSDSVSNLANTGYVYYLRRSLLFYRWLKNKWGIQSTLRGEKEGDVVLRVMRIDLV